MTSTEANDMALASIASRALDSLDLLLGIGESQHLDLQRFWIAQWAVYVNAYSVCSQVGIKITRIGPRAVSLVALNTELPRS